MSDNVIEIKDLSGNVIYSTPRVRGMTRNRFLKQLIDAGQRDFTNLVFENWDFRAKDENDFIDLQGVNFHGSKFDNSRFDGKNVTGTSFKECSISNCSFYGIKANGSFYMDNANIVDSNFEGATGTYLSLRGATLTRVNASNASFSLMDASFSKMMKVDFTKSVLKKTIWDYSEVIRSKFVGANFLSEASSEFEEGTQSIRTKGTIFVGCNSDDAVIPEGELSQLKWDNRINKFGSVMLSVGIIAGFYMIDSHLGISTVLGALEEDTFKYFGTGVAFVGIYSAYNFVKNFIMGNLEKYTGKIVDKVGVEVRKFLAATQSYGEGIHDMVIAIGKTRSMTPIIKAMESIKKVKHPMLKPLYAAKYILDPTRADCFIVCDRNHLAEALEKISYSRDEGFAIPQDIVILRQDSTNENVPSCIRFHKTGKTTILWDKDGETSFGIIYDDKGNPVTCVDYSDENYDLDVKNIPNASSLMKATIAFERYVLAQNGLIDLDYDREKNYIEARTDGGFSIKSKSVKKLSNSNDSPALIRPEIEKKSFGREEITGWRRDYFLNGKQILNPLGVLDEFMLSEGEDFIMDKKFDMDEFLKESNSIDEISNIPSHHLT